MGSGYVPLPRETDLDVGKIGADHAVHDGPDMLDGIPMLKAYLELLADKRLGTVASKEIFGPHSLRVTPVDVLEMHEDGILGVLVFVGAKGPDRPQSLHLDAILGEVPEKDYRCAPGGAGR